MIKSIIIIEDRQIPKIEDIEELRIQELRSYTVVSFLDFLVASLIPDFLAGVTQNSTGGLYFSFIHSGKKQPPPPNICSLQPKDH